MATVDPIRRIEKLLDEAEPRFRAEFLAMVAAIQNERTLAELATLLSEGRIDEALSAFEAFRGVRATARLSTVTTDTYIAAGRGAADVVRRASGEIHVVFDQVNAGAVAEMQENQLRLIREFGDQQRRATRKALLDGIERGVNPREMARAFRGSIGLTERQVGAVNNYRRLLQNLDSAALARKLRDARFDATVRNAIANDQPLTSRQIDMMVERYRERFLKHRAETIARTEALRSVHQGNQRMYKQAIENGVLQAGQLIQIWNTAKDERVRDPIIGHKTSHRTMHGQRRPIGMPFTSGAGRSLMYPGDPTAPGDETINCRCIVSTRIASVAEIQGVLNVQVIG